MCHGSASKSCSNRGRITLATFYERGLDDQVEGEGALGTLLGRLKAIAQLPFRHLRQ